MPEPSFTYATTTTVGQFRLALGDTDISETGIYSNRHNWSCLFSDEEIGVFLATGSTNLALAAAYRAIAGNRILLSKYLKFEVDGGKYDAGTSVERLLELAAYYETLAAAASSVVVTARSTSSEFEFEVEE